MPKPTSDSPEGRARIREAQQRALLAEALNVKGRPTLQRALLDQLMPGKYTEEVWEAPQRTQVAENLAAGFYDIAPSIPLLLGMAGGGIEATWDELFGEGPQNFSENFKKHLGTGLNKTFFEAGAGGIEAIDDALGLPHQTPEDTLINRGARSVGAVLPIPGMPLVKGAGAAANTTRGALNLLTPAVQTGQGPAKFGGRAAAQLGAGFTIDEGMRDLMEMPSVLNLDFWDKKFDEPIHTQADDELRGGAGQDTLTPMTQDVLTPLEEASSFNVLTPLDEDPGESYIPPDVPPDVLTPLVDDPATTSPTLQVLRDMDRKVQEEQDSQDLNWKLGVAAALGGAYFVGKGLQRRAMNLSEDLATATTHIPEGGEISKFVARADPLQYGSLYPKPVVSYARDLPGTIVEGGKAAGRALASGLFDANQSIANGLRNVGFGPNAINSALANAHVDIPKMVERMHLSGKWGQGFLPKHKTPPLEDMARSYHNLSRADRRLLDRAVLALTEKARLIQSAGEVPTTTTRQTPELDIMIAAARNNPKLGGLLDGFTGFLDNHIDYLIHRGRLTKDQADEMRGRFLLPESEKKRLGASAYMPIYDLHPSSVMDNVLKFVGIHTKRGREIKAAQGIQESAQQLSHLQRRGDSPTVQNPLNPIEAMRLYSASIIEHANTNSYQLHILERLTGVRIDGDKISRMFKGPNKWETVTDPMKVVHDPNGLGVVYLGKGTVNDAGEVVDINMVVPDKGKYSKFKDGSSINDLMVQGSNEIQLVYSNGVPHVFHIPDPGIRRALDLNPQLGSLGMFFDHYKKLFTSLTTGYRSLFGPVSSIFSQQQIMMNLAGREGLLQSLTSPVHSLRGITALAYDSFAAETSRYLAQRLASNHGVLRLAPEVARKPIEALQKKLHRSFTNSMVTKVALETGKLNTGLNATRHTGTLLEFQRAFGKDFASYYPGANEATLLWRFWKGLNSALHEGPAYGQVLRKVSQASRNGEEITPALLRKATSEAKDLAGDMTRVGGSKFAKAFDASVPFSAAMLQSWSSIGTAMNVNPGRFIAGAGVVIGMPTVSELVHNQLLSLDGKTWDDPGGAIDQFDPEGGIKQWSYMDYYWNGFTPQQRMSNMIIFRPGYPPWEPILIPISPEWGLFRGIVMDTVNEVYGLNEVGNVEDLAASGGTEWMHLLAAASRATDVPIPPLVKALFTSLGINVRLGLQPEQSTDPDAPGSTLSFLQSRDIRQGERVTERGGKERNVGDMASARFHAGLQDIFGAGGALLGNFAEAFHAGLEFDPETMGLSGSVSNAFDMGTNALLSGVRSQAKYTGGVFGKALYPNIGMDPVARQLFSKVSGLKTLAASFKNIQGAGKLSPAGEELLGNTNIPPDDPIWLELSAGAKNILWSVNLVADKITAKRAQIVSLSNSTNFGSGQKARDMRDGLITEILQLKAKQLSIVIEFEESMEEYLEERYGRPFNIDYGTVTPRANLPDTSLSIELNAVRGNQN